MYFIPSQKRGIKFTNIRQSMLKLKTHYANMASMIYFDSDMSKSTNTVVYFDWKTVIYIYVCRKSRTQFMLPMEKSHSPAHMLMRLYRMYNSLVC